MSRNKNMAPRRKDAEGGLEQQIANDKVLKHKRRYCRAPGCTRIVKSQGLCQRHGAKPRKCKVDGCSKQAQGNFDGMCKSHFKAHKLRTTPIPPAKSSAANDKKGGPLYPPPPEGESVYDRVLPATIAWNPTMATPMPLIQHLQDGFDGGKPPAWHRNEERRARGMWPIDNPATQLEGWERELVWMEILLLTGNPESSFRHLARGWGRDKGFHMVLAQYICERHGDVERKRRVRGAREGPLMMPHGEEDDEDVGARVWDDACYGDASYNEALVAELFQFESGHSRVLSFEGVVPVPEGIVSSSIMAAVHVESSEWSDETDQGMCSEHQGMEIPEGVEDDDEPLDYQGEDVFHQEDEDDEPLEYQGDDSFHEQNQNQLSLDAAKDDEPGYQGDEDTFMKGLSGTYDESTFHTDADEPTEAI